MAEKLLSDWLAIMMYGYLVDGAGPSIHFAYKATKRQTEKGPVDVLTGEAKNSLAKEKILAQFSDIEKMSVSKQQQMWLECCCYCCCCCLGIRDICLDRQRHYNQSEIVGM